MPSITRLNGREPWYRRLYLPAYTVVDAARYAGIHPQTIRYWHYRGGSYGPALPGKERGRPLSYLQLVEVAFVATFRKLGVTLRNIRRSREYVAQLTGSEFPFAEYRFQIEGKHMLLQLQDIEPNNKTGHLVITDKSGQLIWNPRVQERFAQFEYESGLALRWRPASQAPLVVIDPRVSFGAPTVHGIPTWVIRGRSKAGEAIQEIQQDFGLEEEHVLQALSFEEVQVAA